MYVILFAKVILVLAAAAYASTHLLKVDPIQYITNDQTVLFFINLFVVFTVAHHLFNRDYYLPFLGPTVIPIKERETVGKLVDIVIDNLPPNTRILYWAANESDKHFDDPIQAYSGYGNSGVSKSDETGKVTIRVNCPSEYSVGKFMMNKKLDKHIHYRIESSRFPGLFSGVKTKYVQC
jgi:hypothetical protein